MEIDKTIGEWSVYATYLDDIAYSLFIEREYEEKYPVSQYIFMYNSKSYYDESKIIIRKEKIEKILSRGNR